MKKALMLMLVVLIAFVSQAQKTKSTPSHKEQKKEIAVSHLPKSSVKWISENLPHAKITHVWKQKDNPKEKYIVAVTIKTKYHTIVFGKKGEFIRIVKK